MERSQLVVDVSIRWLDETPCVHVHMDPASTTITLTHGEDVGLRGQLLGLIRPLLTDLERLPETQPRMEVLSDDSPF